MLSLMGRNVIVSEDTVRDLLEAHASLSAWYYELWAALRAANATARAPDDAARTAFVEHLAVEFPEVAAIARTLGTPRTYVPAPPLTRSAASIAPAPLEPLDEPATVVERAPARLREMGSSDEGSSAGPGAEIGADEQSPGRRPDPSDVPPPPLVDPASVKYGH
jgi:hypothetical protein